MRILFFSLMPVLLSLVWIVDQYGFILPKGHKNFPEEVFPPSVSAYVINLPDSVSRYQKVWPFLDQLGFSVNKMVAINGKSLEFDEEWNTFVHDKKYYKYSGGRSLGLGVVGCYLSHLRCWQAFLSSSDSFALVCEDDIFFDPQELRQLIQKMMTLKGWDICSFQLTIQHHPLKIRDLSSSKTSKTPRGLYAFLGYTTGGGCYLLNRKAASVLLSKAFPIVLPVDDFFMRHWESGLNFVAVSPSPVQQWPGVSEIEKCGDRCSKRGTRTVGSRLQRALYHSSEQVCRFIHGLKIFVWNRFFMGDSEEKK